MGEGKWRKRKEKRDRKRNAQLDEAAQLKPVMEHLGHALGPALKQIVNGQNLVKAQVSVIANCIFSPRARLESLNLTESTKDPHFSSHQAILSVML